MRRKASKNASSNPVPSLGSDQAWNQTPPSTGTGNAAVRAPDFRNLLRKYRIFINIKEPSTTLGNRAKKIITKELSSEMDDSLAEELVVKVKKLEAENEATIVSELRPVLLPSRDKDPESLAREIEKLWSHAAVIRPNPDGMEMPPALPKPKPDMAFGYSLEAFDKGQLKASGFLRKGTQNYASPHISFMFPFCDIEFKAQATGGTQFIATNQVANAGAVAMEGTLELTRRISAENNIDFDEPQFFSVSIDNATAIINVHWLSRDAENGEICFHMTSLQWYILDANGLKAVYRAITNILSYGVNERLARIRRDLDIYRDIINKGAAAAATEAATEKEKIKSPCDKRRTKRRRQAKGDTAYGEEGGEEEGEEDEEDEDEEEEDEDEDGISSAAPKKINSGLNLRRKTAENRRAKNIRAKKDEPAPETGGGSSKLTAVKVSGKRVL